LTRLLRIFAAGIFSLAPIAGAPAQAPNQRYGDEYQKCNNGNTADIVHCVDALVRQWDTRLNEALKKLMDQITDPKRREDLRAAQDLWGKFREANCSWYASGEGTIARIEGVECMRSMTADRAFELEEAGETH
jgi:uncharacterized protein YecT (DUF1311 family)